MDQDRPLPRILDDVWEPPPSQKRRPRAVAACIGIGLILTLALLGSRARLWEPGDERVWVPIAAVPARITPDTEFRAAPPTPNPPEPPMVQRPAARAATRPAGYLSINSSPWAELSVDGHVVGSTPQVRIRVTSGRHHLLLVRAGFQPHSAWVTVPAGATVRLTDITLAAATR